MGMAVLLGKENYDIAALCEKEILKSLIGTDYDWLYQVLQTLEKGNIDQFKEVSEKYDIFNKYDLIKNSANALD